MIQCVFVGMGGFLGAVFRYLLGLIPVSAQLRIPVITLGINVLGAFVIGMIAGWTGRIPAQNPNLILFLKTGLCGGFTTFSTFALETGTLVSEEKLKRQLLKEESLEQSLLHADKLKEEMQKFYQALNEQSGSVAIPGVVALTGVKKDGNDTQIGHRVNHLLLELSVKTKNGYLKDIAENYNFDVAGEMKVADVIEDEETIQLKQYLDQQILNCDKTQEQRLRELKKSRKKIRTLKKQIKELKADEPRVFDPMNLLKKSNLSVEEIRLMLKGSALEEEAPAFYKCEKKYGVNAVVVMGIAIHESAWGTSRRAREDHNLTGYGVTSDSAKGINAPTKEENLLMTAKLLKDKYLVKGGAYYHGPTVKGVNQCYCVGNTWAGYVTNRCYEIMKRL